MYVSIHTYADILACDFESADYRASWQGNGINMEYQTRFPVLSLNIRVLKASQEADRLLSWLNISKLRVVKEDFLIFLFKSRVKL